MSEQHIRILDKSVASHIAAGEVVERPASVVKELIENAIDAGARAISVEIREGGVALICVSDDGSGMSPPDAALAVERFATSKVSTLQDLGAIKTLGFRGEALAAIASVTQLEILTRTRDQIEGVRARVIEGKIETQVAGAPIGTQVAARNLFHNAPARRKFLKAPLRETELIQKTVLLYALAYPHVAFRFVVDGRERFAWPAATPLERVGMAWGREAAAEMIAVDYSSVDLRVRGFVSRPGLARASRDWQAFFVNNRPIRSGLLAVMLERPYAGRFPPNRYPLAAMWIELDPTLVDVNVHPRKAEVRFYQERAIYGAVTQAVTQALREFPCTVSAGFTAWPFADTPISEAGGDPALRESPAGYGGAGDSGAVPSAGDWRAVGQIHNTFILAQSADGLVIVDQHAAQEQIFYERLIAGMFSRTPLRTAPLTLMPDEARLLNQHLEDYGAVGIDLEPFGENTIRLNALPAFIQLDPPELITALVQEHTRHRALEGDALRDKLAAKAACLSAVKAGDVLEPAQQQALLDELRRAYSPAACPHGRPVFVIVKLEELERRFLRR